MKKLSPVVQAALIEAGARFKRMNKHIVYELPNGQNIVVSRSASDHRAEQNLLREIDRRSAIKCRS